MRKINDNQKKIGPDRADTLPRKEISGATLTRGSIGWTLIKLSIPTVISTLGMVLFNLVDAYFVGRLGTLELAAIAFTFPVIFILNSFRFGIAAGASALISRTIGEGNQRQVKRLTASSLLLGIALGIMIYILGQLTFTPLFRLLGATDELLPMIRDYMQIWYLGQILFIAPIGDSAIRATGDTIRPSLVMLSAFAINFILDPIFIFGLGPIPFMGLQGAALATAVSRIVASLLCYCILRYHSRMLPDTLGGIRVIISCWKKLLYIGLPTAGAKMVVPLAAGIVTRLISPYGFAAIAGFGVACRIEFFVMVVVKALDFVIGPFTGQNLGARMASRTRLGIRYSYRFSIFWGSGVFLMMLAFADPLAAIFNQDPSVVSTAALYLKIVGVGFGFQGILNLSGTILNVLHKPIQAAMLSLSQVFLVFLPLALIGEKYFNVVGIFGAMAVSFLIMGNISRIFVERQLNRVFPASAEVRVFSL